jgi:HK97 family phage major capsid protein
MSAQVEAVTAELSKHFEKVSVAVKSIQTSGEKAAERIKAVEDSIQQRAQAQDARILDLEQKLASKSGAALRQTGDPAVNIAAQVAKDPKIEAFRKGEIRNVKIDIPGSMRMLRKSVLTNLGTSGASPDLGYPGFPQQLIGIPQAFARRRLVVLEALNSTPMSTEGVNWPRLDTNSDAAAPQTHEGASKAETTLTFDREQLKAVTVATFLNATMQVLADNPMLVDFINTVLLYNVQKKFEDLVVNGNGQIGSDQVSGLMTQGTTFSPTLSHAADMIGQSVSALTALGYSPDLIILNPATYFEIVSARDLNERYIAGGWAAPRPDSLWGVNVAQTSAVGAGNAIVLDTSRVTVLDREQNSIRLGYTGNQFIENQITILAEMRGNLGVYDAKAVNVFGIPSNSP